MNFFFNILKCIILLILLKENEMIEKKTLSSFRLLLLDFFYQKLNYFLIFEKQS